MGPSESSESGKRYNNNTSGSASGQPMQEEEKRSVDAAIETGVAVAAVVGMGLVAWGLGSLFSSSESKEKMMKAPGRDYSIPRRDFEDDPAKYFRGLRKP